MTVTNRYGDKIRPGQVWADNDPRSEGRTLRVDFVEGRYAYCEVLTAIGGGVPKVKRVRMSIDRLHPTRTGYRLIEDSEENGPDGSAETAHRMVALSAHGVRVGEILIDRKGEND